MTLSPTEPVREVLVTGASGLIGRGVVECLLSRGIRVRAMTRSGTFDTQSDRLTVVKGDMGSADDVHAAVRGVSHVIHLAARKSDEADSVKINVEGTKHLLNACAEHHVSLLVHVSTPSASLKNPGVYGRTKRESEDLVRASSVPFVILRPSIVYADFSSGILGSIRSFLKLPFVPVVGSGQVTYAPIHRDDLSVLLADLLTEPRVIGGTFDVGGPDIISFNEMLHVCMDALHIHKHLVHLPIWFSLLMAHALRALPHPALTVSNVRGSVENVPLNLQPLRDIMHYRARTLREGIASLTDQKALKHSTKEEEADALLRYVLRGMDAGSPSTDEITRYMQACRVHVIDPHHELPPSLARSPWKLGALDASSKLLRPHSMFQKKLLIAATITETSTRSAQALLPKHHSMFFVLSSLVGEVLMSAFLLFIGCIFFVVYRRTWKTYVGC